MEFDSPEVAKEFPGLFKPTEEDKEMELDYDEDEKKKRKDKKEKKDKGYAALADDSNDEDEPAGTAAGELKEGKKILKGFKLSKKKDKEKEKNGKKEKKDKEKRKEKDIPVKDEQHIPFSAARIPFSAERHKDVTNRGSVSVPMGFFASTPNQKKSGDSGGEVGGGSSGINAFLNAPAPVFKKREEEVKSLKKKEKDAKKEKKEQKEKKEKKEQPSGVAKVKLKLMRSKNSLEDPHEKGDGSVPVSSSHQFPEDPELIAKEIKKYELQLEQMHAHLKSCKKVSKKQEEQLWELQRVATALKRKLRSINALSTTSMNVHTSGKMETDSTASTAKKMSVTVDSIPAPTPTPDTNTSALSENTNLETGCGNSVSETIEPPVPSNDQLIKQTRQSCELGIENEILEVESNFVIAPVRKTARRSLDFSEIDTERDPIPVVITANKNDASVREESSQVLEQMEVKAIVHTESIEEEEDKNSSASDISDVDSELEDDPTEIAKDDENIGYVVDDANAMIGSLHEELEAASLVLGHKLPHPSRKSKVSKSEPTFGEQTNDSSDVELIRDEEEDEESLMEDFIPEILNLPEFNTPEYLAYENDQLAQFNSFTKEEIIKEGAELEILLEQLNNITTNGNTGDDEEECDMERLISIWSATKAENESLHLNVSRLRQMVALSKLEEFKLEARLRFLEERLLPDSPVTTISET